MSKALFISNGDAAATELANGLAVKHRLRKCSTDFGDFLNAVDKEKPEMVFVMVDDNFYDMMFSMIVLECPETPIVAVGSEEKLKPIRSSGEIPADWVKFIKTPVKASDVLQRTEMLLKKSEGLAREKKPKEPYNYKHFTGTGKPHILLVDDDPMVIRAMQKTLAGRYEVTFSTSGQQALTLIAQKTPDLILLDYEMPEMDGLEVLKKLRSDESTKYIPVIFLTGLADTDHVFGAVEMLPQGYLLKPCSEQRLFSEIDNVLGIHRQ